MGALMTAVLGWLLAGSVALEAQVHASPAAEPVAADYSRRDTYAVAADNAYRSPIGVLCGQGDKLYVTCEGTDQILVLNTRTGAIQDSIAVGREPFGMLLSADGTQLFVTHRWDNDVGVVDLATGELVERLPVGEDPHEMVLADGGQTLYVSNLGTDDISVIDLAQRVERKRLAAGNAPFGLTTDREGQRLFVSSQYSSPVTFREPPELELTVIDMKRGRVRERRRLPGTVIAQGMTTTIDGRFVVTTLELPKNLVPQTQVFQGWMVTYGLAFSETHRGGRTAYLLLDEPTRYFADPYDVVASLDGRYLFVSSSGADMISVVDVAAAYKALAVDAAGRIGLSDAEIALTARHLGLSSQYVVARIPTGSNPKGMTLSADGRRLYVATRLEDAVMEIDTQTLMPLRRLDLGGPDHETLLRKGARVFHYASISFHQQMSCNTCHPENNVDGLTYDIAVDGGMGRNLVDNMTLRGLAETAPFKWSGKNPNLQRQEGPRAAQLFFRTHGFGADENEAIVAYLESLPQRPNLYRQSRLTAQQRLGKELYERDHDNLGRYIPTANRCITCHPAPYGTDRRRHDIGSRAAHDWDGVFDTPHLINTYERPPYMHDGRSWSLEEIWTRHNDGDTHGVTNDMTKDQLNALIEYIKTF